MATTAVASAVGAGAASADENYDDTRVGPQFALIRTGQIEDPLENVLDHLAVLAESQIHS
jgi:hypothetical protein